MLQRNVEDTSTGTPSAVGVGVISPRCSFRLTLTSMWAAACCRDGDKRCHKR